MERAGIFSEHVRLLAKGERVPDDHFGDLWQALRAVLVDELRKRALWSAPPAYLGIYGGGNWSQEEVLEELQVECYTAAFLQRLRSLHAQLRARPSIDGLIFLNVRNFLHDTQKKHDPLGFRLFKVLRAAVRALIGDGLLRHLAGDSEIRNDTVVGFDSGEPHDHAAAELGDRPRALADALLPDLVTALGKAQVKLIRRLAEHLAGWRREGVAAFRFRDLCTALSNDVRGRWAAIWRQQDGPTALEALPEVRADLAGTLGNVYTDLGLYEEGREMLEEAVRSRRAHRQEDHVELAIDINNLGKLLYNVGDYDGAEHSFRDALTIRRQLGQEGAELAIALANLASVLSYRGTYEEAEELYRQLLTIRKEAFGPEDPRVGSILYSLGSLFYLRCEAEQAEPLLRQALAIRRDAYGDRDTRVATVVNSLGRVLFELGDLEEARRHFDKALDVRRDLLGDGHPSVALTHRDLAALALAYGDTGAAGDHLEAALSVFRHKPDDDFSRASTESVYGAWLTALGRYREAEPYMVDSLQIIRRIKGERSIYTRNADRRIKDLYRFWDGR